MSTKANQIERYYDTHEMEGAELTQSRLHHEIILYLILVVRWIFEGKNVGVTSNVNFYQTGNPKEPSKSPDLAVVEGLQTDPQEIEATPSYYVGEDGPPPLVVFEIASKETWRQDLEDKPAKYEAMGVNEYFVFDPNKQSLWTGQWRNYNRLVGWRRNRVSGKYELLEKDSNERLWSEELQSWLVAEDNDLELYTADGQLRLTKEEAETRRATAEAHRANIEARRADTQNQRANIEARRAAEETRRAAEEALLKEKALLKAARLAEQLRKLGIEPEE